MRRAAAPEPLIWDQAETLPREKLAALQLDRLRTTVARVLTSCAAATTTCSSCAASTSTRRR